MLLFLLSAGALFSADSKSVFSLEGMKGIELSYPDSAGRDAVSVSFSDAKFESRKQCFYFKVNALKTLVVENLKIRVESDGKSRLDAPNITCPIEIRGFEITLNYNNKKIRIVSDFAKLTNCDTIKFPQYATLTLDNRTLTISEAYIKYETSEIKIKTKQREVITLKLSA